MDYARACGSSADTIGERQVARSFNHQFMILDFHITQSLLMGMKPDAK